MSYLHHYFVLLSGVRLLVPTALRIIDSSCSHLGRLCAAVAWAVLLAAVLLAAGLLLAGPLPAVAQEAPVRDVPARVIVDQVDQALIRGDAESLIETAGDRLEVSLFGSSTQYSASQAQYVLRDFFRDYPPYRLSWIDAALAEGDRFATGQYWVEGSQQPLRVYIRLQTSDSSWVLREVRVEQGSP